MRVYELISSDDSEQIIPSDEDIIRYYQQFSRGTLIHEYEYITVRIIKYDENNFKLPESSFPWLGQESLIMRPDAYEAIKPIIASFGQLFPLKCETDTLYAFNCTNVIPALDLSASDLEIEDGELVYINKHAFHPDVIGESTLFKVPDVSTLFVTDGFADIIYELGLTGLNYELLWESS